MAKKGKYGDRSTFHKTDHGGDYFALSRAILRSPAFLSLSHRARSALLVLGERFNNFNNGTIGLSIENLGRALGNQNHRANSAALLELMDRGFVECVSGANHLKHKAREYRLTFVATGDAAGQQATNEWRSWAPRNGNIGLEPTAVETWKPHEATATPRKLSTEATATPKTETCGFGGRFRPEATATHILPGYAVVSPSSPDGNSFARGSELRSALNRLIADRKTTAAEIANAISMPVGTMSKFRAGRNLPENYRGPLHWELGRRNAFTEDQNATAA